VRGVLNVVDDEPAPVREWLPILAELLDAPHRKHLPVALARLTAGVWGVAFMTPAAAPTTPSPGAPSTGPRATAHGDGASQRN
jgi:hypothetical protein